MSAPLPADPAGTLFARHALLDSGWAHDVLLHWDAQGTLSSVDHGATPPPSVPQASGPVVPGLPNLHSHAFQRVFAGFTEQRSGTADSFWSWRERMYRVALAVSPAQLEEIATLLYIEMLCAGYTSVCEFHYLHHAPDGQSYADPAEMSLRLAAAARRAGITLTLLPVLYQQAGFGARPPRDDQRRFIHSVDGLLRVVERLRAAGVRIGVAPHSLRAVAPPALSELLIGLRSIDAAAPVHIHIAEQVQEVEECLAWSGARPVQWLLDQASVDARWCVVHATHMTPAEAAAVAASGATIGLCPSTEANLGDGVFDATAFVARGGHWGIGSDSHASVDAFEELRLLEYSQRLHTRSRNVLTRSGQPQVADAMWLAAVAGGARAEGRELSTQFPAGAARAGLMAGAAADFLVLDQSGDRAGLEPAQLLASQVFAPRRVPAVREAWVAGQRVVQEGQHPLHERACENFVASRRQLLAGL